MMKVPITGKNRARPKPVSLGAREKGLHLQPVPAEEDVGLAENADFR